MGNRQMNFHHEGTKVTKEENIFTGGVMLRALRAFVVKAIPDLR